MYIFVSPGSLNERKMQNITRKMRLINNFCFLSLIQTKFVIQPIRNMENTQSNDFTQIKKCD